MPPVTRLDPETAAELAGQSFTYAPVGRTEQVALTGSGGLPSGFHVLRVRHEIGRGDAAYAHAAETLTGWRMHTGAGLRVAASSDQVATGAVVRCGLGPLSIPCRVLWVVDEPDRRGFGYGTLPGHPESGEEAFVVRRDPDGRVLLDVTAYSRAGRWLTRLAGPAGRVGQRLMVRRYARALEL